MYAKISEGPKVQSQDQPEAGSPARRHGGVGDDADHGSGGWVLFWLLPILLPLHHEPPHPSNFLAGEAGFFDELCELQSEDRTSEHK